MGPRIHHDFTMICDRKMWSWLVCFWRICQKHWSIGRSHSRWFYACADCWCPFLSLSPQMGNKGIQKASFLEKAKQPSIRDCIEQQQPSTKIQSRGKWFCSFFGGRDASAKSFKSSSKFICCGSTAAGCTFGGKSRCEFGQRAALESSVAPKQLPVWSASIFGLRVSNLHHPHFWMTITSIQGNIRWLAYD